VVHVPQDELFDHGNIGNRRSLLQLIANWNIPAVNKKPGESVNKKTRKAYRGYSPNPNPNVPPVNRFDTGSTQILSLAC
jgi:hypothetical protein